MASTASFTLPKVRNFWERISRHLVLILVVVFVLLLILVPLVRLFISSFQLGNPAIPEGWTLQNYVAAYSRPIFYSALGKTVLISAIGTFISAVIAILFAWLIERTDMPFRNLAWGLILIPMAIPGALFALGWVLLLAPNIGVINVLMRAVLDFTGLSVTQGPLNIYSLGGLIFLEGMRGVTTFFLMLVGAFRMMDQSLEEAARVAKAGAATTFFSVTLPTLLPALLTAAMYTFISSMDSFEAPLAVGLPAGIFVLPTLIYFSARLQQPVDYGLSAAYGITFMVIMIFMLIAYRRAVRYSERFSTVTGKGFRPRVVSIGKWRYAGLVSFVVYFVITVVAPFAILLWASLLPSYRYPSLEALSFVSLANYAEAFSMPRLGPVVWHTVFLVAITATATMVLALFSSWIVVRSKLPGRALLDGLLFLPHSIPGIVIALAMIMAYLSPPLRYLGIYGSIWIVAMGLIVTYIGFGTRLMNGAIVQIQKELEEAAYVCRATATRAIFAITLPLLFPVFAAGWIWVAVHALRSFSIPLMLASRNNEVFSVMLWQAWADGDIGLAATLGVMLIIVLIPLTLIMRRFIIKVSVQQS